jgi:DNA-binding NtrC family response regulator
MRRRRILVVEPDSVFRFGLVDVLQAHGFECVACATFADARRALAQHVFDAVWTEWITGEGGDAAMFVRYASREAPTYVVTSSPHPYELGVESLGGARVFGKREARRIVEQLERHAQERDSAAIHAAS